MSVKYSIDIKSNVNIAEAELERKEENIAFYWGLLWQEIASKLVTRYKAVDTGRLRASLTFVTRKRTGIPASKVADSKSTDFLSGTASQMGEVIVGSNVPYAKFVNNGTSRMKARPFMKESFVDFKEDYENVAKNILEQ